MSDRNICTGTKKDGAKCGMINTLSVILDNGTVTYRCRQHRDGLTIAGSADVGQPMPTTKFKTRADAERFTQWVLEQGAHKRMDAARINALMKAVSQFNKLQERWEQQVRDEFLALLDRARDEYKRLHEIAAAEEGSD